MIETPHSSMENCERLAGIPWSLIAFPIPDIPTWRSTWHEEEQHAKKAIQDMLADIVHFQERWTTVRSKVKETSLQNVQLEMRQSFIQHINVEEAIGTQEQPDTNSIVADKENVLLGHRTKIRKRLSSKSEIETSNLWDAHHYLLKLAEEELKEDATSLGMLEREECIQNVHKILMTGLISKHNTGPGEFSTKKRTAIFEGDVHEYPIRSKIEDVERIVDTMVDHYNSLIEGIKRMEDREERTAALFKCAAWFLFSLVSEHPFSDGNGRLCRLLASYALNTVTPFPTPIYNIYSPSEKVDYVRSIVKARGKNEHPRDLTALIIESNWFAWHKFFDCLNIKHANDHASDSKIY